MASDTNERFMMSGPKGVIGMVLSLIAGGGVGAAVVGTTQSRPAVATPWLTKAEVDAAAKSASDSAQIQAQMHADQVAATTLSDCRRELASAQTQLAAALGRLDTRLDRLETGVGEVRESVAALTALRGRR